MKRITTLLLTAIACAGPAQAMMRIDGGAETNHAQSAPVRQSGKLDAIHAGASKMVIGGVTYAYNPLTTVVMINGKRSTISDVRVGEMLQFQVSPQGAHQPELLTTINVQRK